MRTYIAGTTLTQTGYGVTRTSVTVTRLHAILTIEALITSLGTKRWKRHFIWGCIDEV